MPATPTIRTLSGTSAQVINAIRNSASVDYRNFVPYVNPDSDSIRAAGNIIMQMPMLQNEFCNLLINRIAKVVITSKMYSNPWKEFKKGILEVGETVEDIFVDLQEAQPFDPEYDENRAFARDKPDVLAAFYPINSQVYYEVTISQSELRKAFATVEGVTDLVNKIIERVYAAYEYDELISMKYMVARHILDGHLHPETIQAMTSANASANVAAIKGISNAIEFPDPAYNLAGVHNHSLKEDQYLILSSTADAQVDVMVLAAAFHMDKAEFMGHRKLINSWQFSAGELARLDKLFGGYPAYREITSGDNTALANVQGVLVDRDFFQVYDALLEMRQIENPRTLSYNHFLHVWRTYAISPFAPAIVFTSEAGSITSVTVSPATVSVPKGGQYSFTAAVVASGIVDQSVTWSATSGTMDANGTLHVPSTAETSSTITVTATSNADSTKKGTATVTVTA